MGAKDSSRLLIGGKQSSLEVKTKEISFYKQIVAEKKV